MTRAAGLEALRFDNRFTRDLPADPAQGSERRQIRNALYSRVQPQRVRRPELVAHSAEVAELLGLADSDIRTPIFADVFSGNHVLSGMDPYATCYGGHQFGNWAGQLGDGRAINLGEVATQANGRWVLQLKGAGPTPYSRTADGLAVLRSSLREFLCSEAMFHLGVPTTRALSLTLTGESVVRDILYDGHPAAEPGAVVCRVAPSFSRFGHFEMLAARQEHELLRQFVDYTIGNDFPALAEAHQGVDPKSRYLAWFREVSELTAQMVIEWMRVGFVHGVMNTDNMSILGLTIDYGPYGWLENYDPDWTPNTTDAGGKRYRFAHQPAIAQWNLVRLANAIYPLIEDPAPLEEIVRDFSRVYGEGWLAMMGAKLGLRQVSERDTGLLEDLERILQLAETDMTLFFRRLPDYDAQTQVGQPLGALFEAYYTPGQLTGDVRAQIERWLEQYRARANEEGDSAEARKVRMNRVNPKYVLRNYMSQLAIDAAETGDYSLVDDLLDVLRNPFDEQVGRERHAERRPDWARTRVGCSMLSCSS